MRATVWMVLLLLLPAASGLTPLLPVEKDSTGEGEHLLVLNEGVWTSQQWKALEDAGIQPLRSLRADALLVWADLDRTSWPVDAVAKTVDAAEVRSGLAELTAPVEYRILLEPRLPPQGVDHVREAVDSLGLSIKSTSTDVSGNLPASMTLHATHERLLGPLLETDGVLWIEPVLQTRARNGQAAALIQSGVTGQHPFASLGLNGSGVVIGVADSGLDADHACFRNATTPTSEHAESDALYPAVGHFGANHRKILHLNTAVDGNDTPGHSDYRHGTHVIGSLACHDVEDYRHGTEPSNGSTLAHGSLLVVQDIVSSNGWEPPNVDQLLWESSSFNGVIHANSWGDDTTAYTERTARFDAYARVMPWSLAVIAPGNSGEGVLEPANGRNVVAVGAVSKALEDGRWGSSAYGPTEAETDGIFLLAPGANIESAGADGFWDTNNNNLRLSSGTSMSTPHASGAAAVIQQLYQDGWLMPAFAPTSTHYLSDLAPGWAEPGPLGASVQLGEGFTPSGSLLRASLAMATTPLPLDLRNGGGGGFDLHNPYDGWGTLNLSRLFDPTQVLGFGESPSDDTWIHDSYRLTSGTVEEWFEANKGTTNDLDGLIDSGALLTGASGPFLETGDVFSQRLTLIEGDDVRIRMAFPAQPEPAIVDDLQLRVRLEDGTILLPDRLREGGFAPTEFYPDITDTNDTEAFPPSNETVFGLDIPSSYLFGSSYLDVDVIARYVQPGGAEGTTGLDGDAVGFALVVKGVQRDADDHMDADGDGVMNIDDACPNVPALPVDDTDGDGCPEDGDGDGIPDKDDACPSETAPAEDDMDGDGCLDDDDQDGVTNRRDMCPNDPVVGADENNDGCDDANQWKVMLRFTGGCSGCTVVIDSVRIEVDGFTVHGQPDEHVSDDDHADHDGHDYHPEESDLIVLHDRAGHSTWSHVLSQDSEVHNMENFETVKLEANIEFSHSNIQTTGRQWMGNPCWPFPCGGYVYTPLVNWNLEFELANGQTHQIERVVTISSHSYSIANNRYAHSLLWYKLPVVDFDGDQHTEPGTKYQGPCGVDIPQISGQQNRAVNYACDLKRNNVFDAFPNNPTQWKDSDNDGYGDNSSGIDGDPFPNDSGQWSDHDGDGYGDNRNAPGWDDCPYTAGPSHMLLKGCLDADLDGYADECGDLWCGTASVWVGGSYIPSIGRYTTEGIDSCPGIPGTSFETRYGCPDEDGDGWADPLPESDVGTFDACPDQYGTATSPLGRGCPDADGDGWADREDAFPNDDEFWLDADGDGVPDEEDDFPNNRLFSSSGEVETLLCGGFCFGIIFLVGYALRRSGFSSAQQPVALEEKMWLFEQEPAVEENRPPPTLVVGNLGEQEDD